MTTNKDRARILKKLKAVWDRNPQMRFCQLIENLTPACEHPHTCCIFHVEDSTFEKQLDDPFWETKS